LTWQQQFVLIAPMLLFSMVAHEYAHGWAALRQGDSTAWSLGRLTWNPIKHIDPFMTILLPLMLAWAGAPIIGGAKPVPVNPRNYRNLRRGDIIVSLAGVTANLLIAFACVPVVILVGLLGGAVPALAEPLAVLQRMAVMGIFLNMILVAFNLLPIPPLDGSHVFKWLLPPRLAYAYQRLAGAGILVLLFFMYFVPGIRTVVVGPALFVQSLAERLYLPFMLPNPLS
jgi:Zn-dependent protease